MSFGLWTWQDPMETRRYEKFARGASIGLHLSQSFHKSPHNLLTGIAVRLGIV